MTNSNSLCARNYPGTKLHYNTGKLSATGLTLVALEEGHVDTHLHSFESSFYVFSGEPVLYLDGRGVRLEPDACGAIPVGLPHAWRADGRAEWIEMASPRPRGPDQPPDGPFEDGTEPHANPPTTTQFGDAEDFGAVPTSYSGADMGVPNSPGERQVVSELLALQQGTSPDAVPAWSTMLVGPLYRGTEVKLT